MNKYVLLISGVCAGAIGGYLFGKRKTVEPEPEQNEGRGYNPVEKAYDILLACIMDRVDDPEVMSCSMQEAIGYLGEALDE